GGWRATVRSRPDGAAGSQVRVHVTTGVTRPVLPVPERLGLTAETAGWGPVAPPRPPRSRFVFGPRFDVVTGCRRGGDPDTTVGLLELPELFDDDLAVHAGHPA